MHLVRGSERGDAERCREHDHREGRPGRLLRVEPRGEDEERNDDDPSAHAEERAEEARYEPDPREHEERGKRPGHSRIVGSVEAVLAQLAEAPERSALIFDVDGVLAPIVARPELSEVPEETRAELRRLAARYLLVACVSGRDGSDARRLVGLDGIEYVGNHGLELHPDAEGAARGIAAFRETLSWPVEDKRLSLSLHYREAPDEQRAVRELEAVAERARSAGLSPRWGRKVLEIRPSLQADKGSAVSALLERSRARRALYAGDDTTDLDAFAGLDAAGLEHSVRLAVASDEGPAELREAADLVVESPTALVELLRYL